MSTVTNVALMGFGKMGNWVKRVIDESAELKFVGAVGPEEGAVAKLEDIQNPIDAVVDFSHPSNLPAVCAYCLAHKTPLVLATTGYSEEDVKKIYQLGESIPIVYTANFSLGVTVLNRVLREIAPILKDTFDMELIEKHHNRKLDSPSGTAKMLLNSINPEGEFAYVNGREGSRKREKEIGVHAVRGGTIAGEHTVLFAGQDEVLEFTHVANSRKIFAQGAVKAVKFITDKKPGVYQMEEVLFGVKEV
ncbi:MAG: 4-hydroxy-tetrahydrodipicolinate reductase [Anaerovorax sp.]